MTSPTPNENPEFKAGEDYESPDLLEGDILDDAGVAGGEITAGNVVIKAAEL